MRGRVRQDMKRAGAGVVLQRPGKGVRKSLARSCTGRLNGGENGAAHDS